MICKQCRRRNAYRRFFRRQIQENIIVRIHFLSCVKCSKSISLGMISDLTKGGHWKPIHNEGWWQA